MRGGLALLPALALAACAGMPENMAAPPLPKSVTVPPGHRHALTLKAMGSLNYECRAHGGMAGAYGWVLDAPDATLMHWSGAGIGRFYAGPTWTYRDGSRVVGKLVGAAPGREGHLPNQLYEAVSSSGQGELAGITYIQRLNAVGAEPRARCDRASVGRGQSVEFSADFLFYRKAQASSLRRSQNDETRSHLPDPAGAAAFGAAASAARSGDAARTPAAAAAAAPPRSPEVATRIRVL